MSWTAEVISVRRRDLRETVAITPTGAHADPRFPSPTGIRQVVSFAIDLVVHAGVPFGIAYALDLSSPMFLVVWIGGFFALSILDRIFVQRATQATIGKAITALRVVERYSGEPPQLRALIGDWLFGALRVAAALVP
ncbi:RDD family protein [Kibdelosporangium philippinense]|uniref:RDD family protein n=1 Tax=Kibdelosporangium philippinense TaxID=211113 RepID=A0ABS8ZDL6_9PSEU|nr:RDD family protein [Kibdelosporangium philippinense]MCE7005925.1 RDD family protein [Kibdelosporangium philippinense]